MDRALVIVTDPCGEALPTVALERALARCASDWRWLAPGIAADAVVDDRRITALREAVRDALGGHPADVLDLPAAGRTKALLISDMDSTMITVECIDELADLVGRKAEVAEVTRRAMNGELDFAAALDARVEVLAGVDASVLDRVVDERVRTMPGAATLVRTMRAHGAGTVLVSGGFLPIVRRVAAHLGFERAFGNRLETSGTTLTGRVLRPVLGAADKLRTLEEERARLGIDLSATLAVGDGANDLPMLEGAGLGVAFRAHPAVVARAPHTIVAGDLTALLYLQGMPRSSFVRDADAPRLSPGRS